MEREIANVLKASGLRHFRYIAFPPVVFEVPERPVEVAAPVLPEAAPAEPELVLAPEAEPILPPLAPQVATPAAVAMRVAAPAPPAPEPIPDPPSWSPPQPAVRPPAGLRLLAEATAAAAPAAKSPGTPRRFALLDDIQTELRPRRARTGRRLPGDLP